MTLEEEIDYLKEQVKLYRFDWLTGLKGRRDFDYDLRHKFLKHDFFLAYYDVNNLHQTNRDKGFAEGDRLIRQVCEDIRHQPLPHTTYRASGDEIFAICCQVTTDDVDNATMVSTHSEKHESVDEMLDYLDRQMIAKKAKLHTRREDDR